MVLIINCKDNRFISIVLYIFIVLISVNNEMSYCLWLKNELGKID